MAGYIDSIECLDIRGTPPPFQRSIMATYHPDGVEFDATQPRGAPFSLVVTLLDLAAAIELLIQDLAALCGDDAITITTPDGIEYNNCYIGAEGPGSGVVVQTKNTVLHQGTEKVLAVLTVSGHIEY